MDNQILTRQPQLENLIEVDLASQINQLIKKHYSEKSSYTPDEIKKIAQRFQEDSYVKISGILPSVISTAVRAEVYSLLEKYAGRKELFVKETDNTPRFMSTVRQVDIARNGKIIPLVYESELFLDFISQIVGEKAIFCPYEKEQYVISRMAEEGDTHGWHWDDYSYSLIWFMEAPPPELGGNLEFIPNTTWDKNNPRIDYYLKNYQVQTRHHSAGEAYLLKADTCLHRVSPLKENAARVMLAYTWASPSDIAKNISHETLDQLYVL